MCLNFSYFSNECFFQKCYVGYATKCILNGKEMQDTCFVPQGLRKANSKINK